MKRILISSLVFSTFVSLSALAAPMADTNAAGNPPVKLAEVKVKVGEILQILMVANSNEVKAGRVALKRGTHPDVKKYAAMMVEDHSQNLLATKKLAETLNIIPVSSNASDALAKKGEKELNKLETVHERRFDKTYMTAMVEGHQKLLNVIDSDLLPNATNPKVVAQLKATREKVAYHLQLAKQIQSKL